MTTPASSDSEFEPQAIDQQEDALAWQAFLYVSSELSPEEQDAFEALLATDLAAQEAVAEAVSLTAAVHAAESESVYRKHGTEVSLVEPAGAQRTWRQPLVWMLMGSAASLALFSLLQMGAKVNAPGPNVAAVDPGSAYPGSLQPEVPHPQSGTPQSSGSMDALAHRWAENLERHESAMLPLESVAGDYLETTYDNPPAAEDGSLEDPLAFQVAIDVGDLEESELDGQAHAQGNFLVPQWMLVAVAEPGVDESGNRSDE